MPRKMLIGLDGSQQALRALDKVIERRAAGEDLEIHLINVQIPVQSGHARMFVSHDELQDYYRGEGLAALAAACRRLDEHGIPHAHHVAVGHIAQTISQFAVEHGCDEIVVGTHGHTALVHLLLGSVAAELVRDSRVPVTLVEVLAAANRAAGI